MLLPYSLTLEEGDFRDHLVQLHIFLKRKPTWKNYITLSKSQGCSVTELCLEAPASPATPILRLCFLMMIEYLLEFPFVSRGVWMDVCAQAGQTTAQHFK